jgi:tetratricopeptide (TPR) repeat protein
VAADPADWQSRRGLARAEQAIGNEQEATHEIQAYLAAHGDDVRAWCDWLEMLHGRGDMTGLAAALKQLPAAADGDGRIWSFRGIVSQAGGDVATAQQAHRRAASLRPHDEQILYRLALAERQAGHGNQAEAHLAQSKTLREARNGLLEALQVFSRAALPGPSQKPEMVDRTRHLASLCQTLGLEREARALRSLVPDR